MNNRNPDVSETAILQRYRKHVNKSLLINALFASFYIKLNIAYKIWSRAIVNSHGLSLVSNP